MPLQKRRLGKARIRNRRSAWMRNAAKNVANQTCPQCGASKLPHRVCMSCGYYGGKQIIEVATEADE